MIKGILRRRRVLVEDEADASTLRNKGYTGINVGRNLSLDLSTALDLALRKKISVFRGGAELNAYQIQRMMSSEERKTAIAFHFLKVKGMKPSVRRGKLYSSGKRIHVFWDGDQVDFTSFAGKDSLAAVVDSEWSCLLYSFTVIGKRRGVSGNQVEDGLEDRRGILANNLGKSSRIESGLKFGAEFRVYEGKSSHATFLMTTGNAVLARDIVARVRISQSVRKRFVQISQDQKSGTFRLFEIRWIRK